MNKKILSLSVLAFILCLGLLLLRPSVQHETDEKKSANNIQNQQSEDKKVLPAHLNSSLFNSLTPNIIAAFTVFPVKFSYVTDHFTKLKTKLSQTKLWKQNNGESLIEKAENEVKKSASENAPKDLSSFNIVNFLTENWRNISEVTFAVLDDSKDIGQGLTLPKLLLEFNTSSAPLLIEFKNYIKSITPLTSAKDGIIAKLEQSANNENEYLLSISSDDSKLSVKSHLLIEATKASLLFNSDSYNEFISSDPQKTLINSEKWNSASHKFYDETFSLYAFQYDKFLSLTQKLISFGNPELGKELPSSIDLYKGAFEFFGGMDYKDGFNISYCGNSDPSSFIGKNNTEFFNKSKSTANKNIFSQLISKNTIFGLNFSAAQINLISTMMLGNFSDKAIAEAGKEPEIKKIIDALSKRKHLFTNFPFNNVYFLLNTPQGGGFAPDSYIFLHGPEKDAPLFLSEVKSLIEEIHPEYNQLRLIKDATGHDMLQMQIDSNYNIFAKYLTDGSIVITSSDAIVDSIQKRLSATKNFSDLMTISGKPAKEVFSKSEGSHYFSNKPIFEFGKPFLGLLSMSAPEIKMTPTDIDEVLKPLEFTLVSTKETHQINSSTLCAESHTVLADIQKQDETL